MQELVVRGRSSGISGVSREAGFILEATGEDLSVLC